MPDVKDCHGILLDGEEYTVYMRSVSVEQLPDLKGELFVFRRKHATSRRFRKRLHCSPQATEPTEPSVSCMLRQ